LPFDQLPKRAKTDPAICLYYERFGKKDEEEREPPNEEDLIAFVRQLKESQLSVATPEGLILPTQNSTQSQDQPTHTQLMIAQRAAKRRLRPRESSSMSVDDNVQCLTGSDDLFASPSSPSPKRRRVHRISSDSEVTDLKAAGIKDIYDPEGNLINLQDETYHCVVRINYPIDLKLLGVSKIFDSDGSLMYLRPRRRKKTKRMI